MFSRSVQSRGTSRARGWRAAVAGVGAVLALGVISPVQRTSAGPDDGHGSVHREATRRYGFQTGYGVDQIVCAPDGEKRFSAIYARPSDMQLDRYAETAPAIRTAVRAASGNLNAEVQSLSTTVGARLRVKCNDHGDVNVASVVLATPRASSDRDTIRADLAALGFDRAEHKYLVFFEGCRAQPETVDNCDGGQVAAGTIADDSTPGVDNPNNIGPDYAMMWCECSDVTESEPYGTATLPGATGGTFLHEAIHTLGFVQPTAPNSTGRYHHCTQYSDTMCYNDGGPNSSAFDGNSDCLDWHTIDCGHDDYLHPHPPEGSYLAGNWNLAASYVEFIDHTATADVSPPYRTTDLRVAESGAGYAKLAWSRAVDRRGVAAVQMMIRPAGGGWATSSSAAANDGSYTVNGLSPGTTYYFAITSVDAAGNLSPRSKTVRHTVDG